MKKTIFLLFAITCATCHAQLSQNTTDTMTWGAKTKITFHVVDYEGKSVSNATMRVVWSYDYTNKRKVLRTQTDEKGFVVIEEKSRGTFTYFVEKGGYYQSEGKHSFDVRGEIRVKGGRWEPWNPIVKVVLKEKRNPAPLVEKGGKHIIPVSEEPLGFDFLSGEMLAPVGSGRIADLLFQYEFQVTNNTGHCSLTLSTVNSDDGMIVLQNDGWSTLKTLYEAPLDGYVPSISFERDWKGRIFSKRKELGADAYVVFRCRTKRDAENNLISANYGILYGPLDFGRHGKNDKEGMMIFRSLFNPTPNERNLEWDGSRR